MEKGEDEPTALARECLEELGVHVTVDQRIGADIPLGTRRALLRVYTARLLNGDRPQALEHAELRWLTADQLQTVEWLPADAPIVAQLPPLLGRLG